MGSHLIIDFTELSFDVLDNMDGLYSIMNAINKACNIHVLGHLKHKFEPQGCSIIFLLAESHFSVHSFPERGYIHFDFYHCGDLEITHQTAKKVANLLIEKLHITDLSKIQSFIHDRG
jgi:S-adenosylmethionine decarboxylase proenzyme